MLLIDEQMLLIFLFFSGLIILWWAGSGYLLTLSLFAGADGKEVARETETAEKYPLLWFVVPTFNEERIISSKIENILADSYPQGRLRVVFVDGGSSDRTCEIISTALEENDSWALLKSPRPGKINQLNHFLDSSLLDDASGVIVISDADAVLDPGAISILVECLVSSPDVGVAGANISPADSASELERQHWLQQNQVRFLESALFSAGSVVAPCYAFRRNVIERFPENCVADDLFVVYHAHTKGLSARYLEAARGTEIRVPTTLAGYVRHKFRKSHACLIEVVRFSSRFKEFSLSWSLIFFAKLLQLLLCPFLILVLVGITVHFFLVDSEYLVAALLGWGVFVVGIVGTPRIISVSTASRNGHQSRPLWTILSLAMTSLVVMAAVLSFPFNRQDSCYAKVSE